MLHWAVVFLVVAIHRRGIRFRGNRRDGGGHRQGPVLHLPRVVHSVALAGAHANTRCVTEVRLASDLQHIPGRGVLAMKSVSS